MNFLEGFALGLTGFVPFAHVNLLLGFLNGVGISFVAALAGSHLVFEAFPAVLFALPSQAHSVSVLPGHRLVLQGKAFKALRATLYSAFYALLAAVLLAPVAFVAVPLLFNSVRPLTGYLLLSLVALFYFRQEARLRGLLVFVLSGALGFLVFSIPLVAEPLFPLLTGLFAVPSLLYSVGSEWPRVFEDERLRLPKRFALAGALIGALSPLVPAVNPALLAGVAFLFLESEPVAFLSLSSGLAVSKGFYDLVYSQLVGAARSGAAAALLLVPVKDAWLAGVSFAAAAFAALAIALALFKPLCRALSRVRMRSFNYFFLLFIVLANALLGGFEALFVLGVASCVGVLPLALGVPRSNAMGALIAPSLLYAFALSAPLAGLLY